MPDLTRSGRPERERLGGIDEVGWNQAAVRSATANPNANANANGNCIPSIILP